MSDSLKETVICSACVFTISAKDVSDPLELDDEDADEGEDAAELVDPAPVPLDPDESLDAELLLPAVTFSPGVRLLSDATVPLTGAYSRVSRSACRAFRTLVSAENTDASSVATPPAVDPPPELADPLEPPLC